jgi:hypothetical protein
VCVQDCILGAGFASLGHDQLPQDELRVLQLRIEVAYQVPQGVLPNVHRLATDDGTGVFATELIHQARSGSSSTTTSPPSVSGQVAVSWGGSLLLT